MKKILLLGGSAQQVIAIETAKRLGLYTVLCDYLDDNPGQFVADKFYPVSTTDKEAVLNVALKEKVNGVLAYASDPAAPTAAYVAEKMGLPTNPCESVEILCNKDKFRNFLGSNCFNTPVSGGYDSVQAALANTEKYSLPVIVKPVDSSGSKGVTVLFTWGEYETALSFAFSFSRCHRVIVEEYIEKKHPYLIGGDIFIVDGKIVLWGLLNCYRDQNVNPLVPVGKGYPLDLDNADIERVKYTLQQIVDKLHIRFGAMNVELVVDKHDRAWPIDIGPRNGGNMIPDLLGMIFKADLVEMSVKAALGIPIDDSELYTGEGFYSTYNLHADKNGILQNIEFSDDLEKCIVQKCIYKKCGDTVEYFDNAAKALGVIFMKFETKTQQKIMLEEINKHVTVKVEVGKI